MTRIKINIIKISILVLIGILFTNIIMNNIVVYQSISQDENPTLILFASILGTILGLVVRSGLTLVFWCSYSIKYPNDKHGQKIAKKIVASFLFLSVTPSVFLNSGMPLVFIICTLVMILKKSRTQYI